MRLFSIYIQYLYTVIGSKSLQLSFGNTWVHHLRGYYGILTMVIFSFENLQPELIFSIVACCLLSSY